MKKSIIVSIIAAIMSVASLSATACQLHANGFGSFAAYHNASPYNDMMSTAPSFPTVSVAKKAKVELGNQNLQKVSISVPLSYYNVSLSVMNYPCQYATSILTNNPSRAY